MNRAGEELERLAFMAGAWAVCKVLIFWTILFCGWYFLGQSWTSGFAAGCFLLIVMGFRKVD